MHPRHLLFALFAALLALPAAASARDFEHRLLAGFDVLYADGSHNNGADDVRVLAYGADFRYMLSVPLQGNLYGVGELNASFSPSSSVRYNDEEHTGNLVTGAFAGAGLMWKGDRWFGAATVAYGGLKEAVPADGSEYLTISAFPMARLASGVRVARFGAGHLELMLAGGIGLPEGRYSPQDWTVAKASISLGFVR